MPLKVAAQRDLPDSMCMCGLIVRMALNCVYDMRLHVFTLLDRQSRSVIGLFLSMNGLHVDCKVGRMLIA